MVAVGVGQEPPRRKFSPVNASDEVTMFQAARPSERWSRVANCLATSKGSLKVVLMVPARPSRSVTAASAARTVKVSGLPTTSRSWMRPRCSRSRKPIGEEEEVEQAAFGGAREVDERVELELAAESGADQTVVLLTPGKCAPR